MPYVIGIISQKGGVGKSALARLLLTELANTELSAKLADMDTSQSTCIEWSLRRQNAGITPDVAVQSYRTVQSALKDNEHQDVLIIDGLPHADRMALAIAKASDLVLLPTGASRDDRNPTTRLANELKDYGIPASKIVLALNLVWGKAGAMIASAYEELTADGYNVLEVGLPVQASYAAALDAGKSLAEASHPSLRKQAKEMAQAIIDALNNQMNEKAA